MDWWLRCDPPTPCPPRTRCRHHRSPLRGAQGPLEFLGGFRELLFAYDEDVELSLDTWMIGKSVGLWRKL